jgi:CRISPR-associated protein Cas2
MPQEDVRYMRMLVMFDLPVKTKKQRKRANRFRQFLRQDGYDMIQLSIYMRLCRGRSMLDKHMSRLRGHLPPEGCVRVLELTDKQFERMEILVGEKMPSEDFVQEQLLLL